MWSPTKLDSFFHPKNKQALDLPPVRCGSYKALNPVWYSNLCASEIFIWNWKKLQVSHIRISEYGWRTHTKLQSVNLSNSKENKLKWSVIIASFDKGNYSLSQVYHIFPCSEQMISIFMGLGEEEAQPQGCMESLFQGRAWDQASGHGLLGQEVGCGKKYSPTCEGEMQAGRRNPEEGLCQGANERQEAKAAAK